MNAEVSTKITTDKEEYFASDDVVISAEASTNISKYMTIGKIEIYDENNNIVSTIADNLTETLTSEEKWENQFNWATTKDTIGNYTAKISWYFGDKLVAMDETEFSVALKKYNVNFVDYDGTILDTQIVEYGKEAIAPKNPEREANEKYTYEFAGWSVDFSNVTSNLIVKANYKEIEKEAPKATETPNTTPIVSSETPKSGDNTNFIVLGFMMIASATTMLLSKLIINKSKRH